MRCSIVHGCKVVRVDLFFYSLQNPCIQKSTGCALTKSVSQSDGIRVSIDLGIECLSRETVGKMLDFSLVPRSKSLMPFSPQRGYPCTKCTKMNRFWV